MKIENDDLITLEVQRTTSGDETLELGFRIGKNCKGGEIIALIGNLGAGKTHLVKGIGKGLGIADKTITSPTFIICQSYTSGRLPLYHFDLYRITDFSEIEDIGWYDYISSEGVVVVEWAEKIEEYIISDTLLWISIEILSEREREFVFKAKSRKIDYLLE